jgi:hypothetical protein
MKNNIYIIIALAFINFSCQKILDIDPIGVVSTENFFKDANDALQGINSAYGPLMFNTSNKNAYWAMGILTTDAAVVGGDGSQPGLTEMDFFTYTPRTEEFNNFWALEYNGITQCNTVIEKVAPINMDEALKNRIIAEAYFLRAFYYFQLTQVYGEVQLITKITPPAEIKYAKSPIADIYAQIIKDCDYAAQYLPAIYSGVDIGRATRGAAYALAAETNLYAKNWSAVLTYVQKVKDLGVYGLMDDYQDNFRKNTQNNKESVWEIQHTNLQLGVGNALNQTWLSKKVPDGYGFAEVTQSYYDEFEPGDPRRDFTIASNNQDYFGVVYKNSFSSTHHSPRKYLQADSTVTQKADGDINVTPIRYAAVLLWEAEALNELGRTVEAQEPLEQVRARARNQSANPDTTLPKVVTTDQEIMRQAIRHEYSVELGFEMHKFFDYVRWGIAEDKLKQFGFIANKNEHFPIPQQELDLNPFLKQNTGY